MKKIQLLKVGVHMKTITRAKYLGRIIELNGTPDIKIITGIRRSGKSKLMQAYMEYLRSHFENINIIFIDFMDLAYEEIKEYHALHAYVEEHYQADKTNYLFVDEVQMCPRFELAINSLYAKGKYDIYVTGSNAFLLSSELSTYLSGRYVEVKMLPLSFAEFLDFQGYTVESYQSPAGGQRKRAIDKQGQMMDLRELFQAYIRFGGMPAISETGLDQKKVHMLLDGIYSAVVVRDILERGRRKEQRAITDALLLRKIILFLSDNIGNNTSIRSIGNTLVTEGLLEEGNRKSKPAVQTISAYIDALLESYIFYEVKRFDIKGKDYLRTLGKYYIVDTGLRNYLLGDRGGDTGHLLENIIYLELFRRGYDVAIGKLDDKEIDFIATSNGPKRYIQVTETMSDSETRKRELAPLMAVQDNYEKVVITMDQPLDTDINGIKIVNALDFLLDGETQ